LIKKIISGGQTGADRAAIDFAIEYNIPHGGWIPKGRKAEDGRLPEKYQLKEMPTGSYSKRTEKNILDSDGTLIIAHGQLTGGSALTREFAKQLRKSWIHLDMKELSLSEASDMLQVWIKKNKVNVLNVAGPRESKDPMIYEATFALLESALAKERNNNDVQSS
jgi:hypothetical protein